MVDHAPGSPWSWYAAEDGWVEGCWRAVSALRTARQRDADAVQTFADFAELERRLAAQGPLSRARLKRLRGRAHPPMPYRLALLAR